MANNPQYGAAGKPGSGEPSALTCAACEVLLADALDGRLNPAGQANFDRHVASCAACTQMLSDARRGMEWLDLLKEARPHPPVGIVSKILAQTSGLKGTALQAGGMTGTAADVLAHHPAHHPAQVSGPGHMAEGLSASQILPAMAGDVAAAPGGRVLSMPAWRRVNLAAVRQAVMQPRLAMTAAMAFFSISLTLNLTGIRLSEIKAADLRPSSLIRQVDEQRWHAVRNFDNLRVVYEVEARVRELRRVSESDESQPSQFTQPSDNSPNAPGANAPADGSGQKSRQQSAPGGTSRREPVLPSGGYRNASESQPGQLTQPASNPGAAAQPVPAVQKPAQQPHLGTGAVVAAAFEKHDKQSSLSGAAVSAAGKRVERAAETSGVCTFGMPERGEA